LCRTGQAGATYLGHRISGQSPPHAR
jgi:hypothetical protein